MAVIGDMFCVPVVILASILDMSSITAILSAIGNTGYMSPITAKMAFIGNTVIRNVFGIQMSGIRNMSPISNMSLITAKTAILGVSGM